jgi:hypothetical protein
MLLVRADRKFFLVVGLHQVKNLLKRQTGLSYSPLYLVRCIGWIGGVNFQHAGIIAQVVQAVPSALIRLGNGVASLKDFNGVATTCTVTSILFEFMISFDFGYQ